MSIINMQTMRYINLLDKASKVRTRKCFVHNNTIFFAVGKGEMSRAIGPGASNINKIQNSIGRKIKVIQEADGISDAKRFIEDIVSPVKVKNIEVKDEDIVITAGNNQTRASLIGRNKRRIDELRRIVQDFFGMDLRII